MMSLQSKLKEVFVREPIQVRSPGRINLIGEHTDYNGGYVMPASIGKEIRLAIAKNNRSDIFLFSMNYAQGVRVSIYDIKRQTDKSWANFVLGVVSQLQNLGFKIGGFDCVFEGNIPLGAGLSSSAALECATIFALNAVFQLGLDRLTMAQIAQQAENEFVGVRCGIMDQFASMFGKANQVIRLDCHSLDFEYSPLNLRGYKIILLDTQVKHFLANSEYNTRRHECESGVAFLRKYYPTLKNLRGITLETLERYRYHMDDTIYRRCRFVISENQRVEETMLALRAGDLKKVGDKMYASHQGLRDEYQVSCAELDFLVDEAKNYDFVLGARMMGGGFGGVTINLVKENQVDNFIRIMSRRYKSLLNLDLKAYACILGDGTGFVGNRA